MISYWGPAVLLLMAAMVMLLNLNIATGDRVVVV